MARNTRAATKASAKARTGSARNDGQRLMREGDFARIRGLCADACPYAPGSDEADCWLFGWEA